MNNRAIVLIKPNAYSDVGDILNTLIQKGYSLCRLRMLHFTEALAKEFTSLSNENSKEEIDSLNGGLSVVVDFVKHEAISQLLNLAGPEKVEQAKKENPESLRAKYGLNGYKNGVYVAKSLETAEKVS
jgi:nucleoside diphosphate kinase